MHKTQVSALTVNINTSTLDKQVAELLELLQRPLDGVVNNLSSFGLCLLKDVISCDLASAVVTPDEIVITVDAEIIRPLDLIAAALRTGNFNFQN